MTRQRITVELDDELIRGLGVLGDGPAPARAQTGLEPAGGAARRRGPAR